MLARVIGLALAVAFAALAWCSQNAAQATRARTTSAEQALIYLPPASRMQHVSLGYRETLADLVWVRAVIATGHPSVGHRLDFVARYIEVISTLAPKFRRPYAWGGVVSVYGGQAITRPMLDQAIALYRQGLHYFPEDHEMLFALGMILFRDLGQTKGYSAEERQAGILEGKNLIRKAAAFGAPELVRQLAVTFADKASSDALEVEFLESQLVQAQDESLRRVLRRKLADVVAQSHVDDVISLRKAVEERHQKKFSYLSLDHFVVLEGGQTVSRP